MHGEEEKYVVGFCGGNLKQRGHLHYPDINGKIIFKLFLTFSHPASYISDGHTATLQQQLFIYLVNKYTY
jgi:hypothetical protein